MPPWATQAGGVRVRVRVTPRGGGDACDGLHLLSDGTAVLAVRVRAAPEDGLATEAVRRVLAGLLACPVSAVALHSGATARLKTFDVSGDPAALIAVLNGLATKDAA